VLVRPDQTVQFLYAKAKMDLDKSNLDHQADLHKAALTVRGEHLFQTTTDAEGNETETPRSHDEVDQLAQAASGQKPPQPKNEQEMFNQGWEMPQTMAPPGGWQKPVQQQKPQWQLDADDDRKYAQATQGIPNQHGLITEHARARVEAGQEQRKIAREDQLERDKRIKEEREDKKLMLQRRDKLRNYKVPDPNNIMGPQLTKQHTETGIDKMMKEAYGVTGREGMQKEQQQKQSAPQHGVHAFSEYKSLPSGALYLAPDGKTRKKK
jgi:hypothetical protein